MFPDWFTFTNENKYVLDIICCVEVESNNSQTRYFFPTVYITVYIEVLFFNFFLYALASNTVDGWKWLEMDLPALGMVA